MSESFVNHFEIDPIIFSETGAFNINLDSDSELYINPQLVRKCRIDEFIDAGSTITNYFSEIVRLVRLSKKEGDLAWNAAKDKLTFTEIKGTCLGYSKKNTSGRSIGDKLSKKMITLMKEMVDLGSEDPIIFEVATFISKGIGSDRVSDILTNILYKNILLYTSNICRKLKIKTDITIQQGDEAYELVMNPFNGDPILLVPFSILSDLPVLKDLTDIEYLCNINGISCHELYKYVTFNDKKGITKDDICYSLTTSKEIGSLLSKAYLGQKSEPAVHINQLIIQMCSEMDSQINAERPIDASDISSFVKSMNDWFKDYIENKGGFKVWDPEKMIVDEEQVQQIYRMMATSFCRNSGVDISPETDHGRGPVDFKFSKGYNEKVLVEIKLTSNSHIKNGLLDQLPIYDKSSDAKHSILLVVDLESKGFDKITETYMAQDEEFRNHFSLFTVDGSKKPSASKVRAH